MKNFILVLGLITTLLTTQAQDGTVQQLKDGASKAIKKDPADTTNKTWKKGGIYGINISQGSLNNWAAGGDNFSFSINSILSLFAFYQKGKHSWDNTLDFNLGYVNTTSLGSRKNDDRIDLLSKYGYAIAPKWSISGLFNFRTQLFEGFAYEAGKAPRKNSAFLSPAYVLLSPGIDFKPNKEFSIFLSPLTARWVIVQDDSLSARGLYGVKPGEHFVSEFGAFASLNYLKEIAKNITYKGRLDLFSNYKHNPQNVDLYMTNVLNLKVSKAISATYSLDLIYDDDARLFGKKGTSPALQVKSLIGLGLLLKF